MKPIVGVVLAAAMALSFLQISGSQKIGLSPSNSDTGSRSAAFGPFPPPNGVTFFGKPSGRVSDGRLIIDFLAEKLGLPYLSAFLDSIGSNFRQGANFAVSGATIQQANGKMYDAGFNPLSLGIQLSQFQQLRARTAEFYEQAKDEDGKCKVVPEEDEFSSGLYTIDMGQNDLDYLLTSMTEEQAKESISSVIDQFAMVLEKLHQLGAKAFWIHNTGPIGCLPFFVVDDLEKPETTDQNGCLEAYNEVAREFNKQLKERVYKLRDLLQGSRITYVDIYSAKYDLISNAAAYGFSNPLGYCCGQSHDLPCWQDVRVNGSCNNPWEYISWDGIHYTETANRWVADRIADGRYSDPQTRVTEAHPNPRGKGVNESNERCNTEL